MRLILLSVSVLLISHLTWSQKIPNRLKYKDIELIDGSTLDGSELKGKVIVTNLWGTWCKPCIAEIPDLNELVEEFGDADGVLFLAIASPPLDTPEKIQNFLEKREFNFRQMMPDSKSIFFDVTGGGTFPTTVVYDKSGSLQAKFVGSLEPDDFAKLRSMLPGLLEE